MVDDRLAEHAAAERTFPATTDCDRLAAAFARLEEAGVLAAEDVGYTQSDLRDEMWERVEQATSGRAGVGGPPGRRAGRRLGRALRVVRRVSDDDEGFRAIGGEASEAATSSGATQSYPRSSRSEADHRLHRPVEAGCGHAARVW